MLEQSSLTASNGRWENQRDTLLSVYTHALHLYRLHFSYEEMKKLNLSITWVICPCLRSQIHFPCVLYSRRVQYFLIMTDILEKRQKS